jgi:hypothetical protein
MIQRTANFITVREVITDMGLEPTNELVSQVEEMMADSFERLCGQRPIKTAGTDIYLEDFRLSIIAFVLVGRMEQKEDS